MHREMDEAEAIRPKGNREKKSPALHFFRRALILKAGILHGAARPWETEKGNRYGIPFLQGYGLPPFAAGAGLYAPAHAGAGRHRHRLRARRGAGGRGRARGHYLF